MMDRIKERGRVKRGGRENLVPIELAGPVSDGTNPDALFDRMWKEELTDRAVRRARRHYSGDREIQFRVFERHDLGSAQSYAEVAEELGIAKDRVRDYLFSVRETVRAELRAELAETVKDPAEFKAEWRALFGA
jgi:DNA-directed RNA polymerase specialized sigma24 family protein